MLGVAEDEGDRREKDGEYSEVDIFSLSQRPRLPPGASLRLRYHNGREGNRDAGDIECNTTVTWRR